MIPKARSTWYDHLEHYSSTISLKHVNAQLTRHVNELNQQIATKEAALRDLQAEYNKWSWVIVSMLLISSWSCSQLLSLCIFVVVALPPWHW